MTLLLDWKRLLVTVDLMRFVIGVQMDPFGNWIFFAGPLTAIMRHKQDVETAALTRTPSGYCDRENQ